MSNSSASKRKRISIVHLLHALRLFAAPIPRDVVQVVTDGHVRDVLDKYNATQNSVRKDRAEAQRLENEASRAKKEYERLSEKAEDLLVRIQQTEEAFFEGYAKEFCMEDAAVVSKKQRTAGSSDSMSAELISDNVSTGRLSSLLLARFLIL